MTVSYKLLVKKSAERELKSIPKTLLSKLIGKIRALSSEPRPHGCEALAGSDKHYRVRQNDYRIVYTVSHQDHVVYVDYIRHRKDVYRGIE